MFFNSLPQCGLYLFPGSPGYGPCFRLYAAGYSKKRPRVETSQNTKH